MSYYFIANIRIHDLEAYQLYINKVEVVFSKYNGEYLAVDNAPKRLEGEWNYTRTVIVKFESKTNFETWYNSTDYQRILKHRLKAADCDTILVKSLEE